MNERFAAEPTTCDNAFELQTLFEKFGPATGRYLAAYPADGWEALLRQHVVTWKDCEKAKATVLLRRAKEKRAIVRGSGIDYDERDAWIPNITRTQASPSCFDGVVVSRSNAGAFPSLEDLDLPPTAAEPIPARTMEYVRVSRTLLSASPEVHFIDAYLDPCDADRKVVLQELLRAASTGRCDIAHVWVSNNRLKRSSIETIDALRRIAVDVGFTTPRRMYLHPFTDAGRSVKVHDRYLLSLYGAIRFEHGFQELSGRRTAKVSPEAPNSHLLLVKTFLEGDHDMDVQTSEIEF